MPAPLLRALQYPKRCVLLIDELDKVDQVFESNALITTKSGQEVTLHLVSLGKSSDDPKVDFLLQYRPPQGLLVGAGGKSFLIADTRPIAPASSSADSLAHKLDPVAHELETQKDATATGWPDNRGDAIFGHPHTDTVKDLMLPEPR